MVKKNREYLRMNKRQPRIELDYVFCRNFVS